MPRTLPDALGFLLGLWAAIVLLLPLGAPRASAADPGLDRLEQSLHQAVNEFRRSQHLIPLERRADLDAVARRHSEDMAQRGFFAHESPEGDGWVERLERARVTGFSLAGENVAQSSQREPAHHVLEGWKRSPVHRENLMSRPMNATGLGAARAPDGRVFVTQLYLNFPR
jgi:uncharacterized protein YkwD